MRLTELLPSYSRQVSAVSSTGEFSFVGLPPATYRLQVRNERLCWQHTEQQVQVSTHTHTPSP